MSPLPAAYAARLILVSIVLSCYVRRHVGDARRVARSGQARGRWVLAAPSFLLSLNRAVYCCRLWGAAPELGRQRGRLL
ncbi:hypothetical protein BGZ61DRAFT_438177 [Ilyonectria robusta]|uniref:uncharacterized protein n=1 Tax=Ilyonectria robusta TaxID=1079257 RepID=UPI001E8CFE79|nr:uncharacterized protein BGZ61DRAFT_438177 [Ilyonectria robusta]KAH8737353.1 hypothetical protein BGZ61DRAFT_438177 [Ilyonectria robusta]